MHVAWSVGDSGYQYKRRVRSRETNAMLQKLKESFPVELFNSEVVSGDVDIAVISISVFDHWLTEEEAAAEAFSFSQDDDPVSQERYLAYERLLMSFFNELYDVYRDDIRLFQLVHDDLGEVVDYLDMGEGRSVGYADLMQRNIREIGEFTQVYISSLDVLLYPCHDLTFQLWSGNTNHKSLVEMAISNGLFVI